MNTEVEEPNKVGDKSPFAGCAIFITVFLVVVFLIVFSVVVLFRQSNAISKFTDEKPKIVQIESLEDREQELNRIAEKIERFRISVMEGKSAVLELSVAELNLAIASYDAFKEMRGMLRVREITQDQMTFDISFKLNGRPRLAKKEEGGIIGSDSRYLNGILITEPSLLNHEVVIKVRDIDVASAEVAKEFIEQMSPYRIAEKYAGDSDIGKVMATLTKVETADGVIRFVKVEGEITKETLTNEVVDQSSKRLFKVLGIAASIFLFFVAVIIFVGLRSKKRQGTSEG